MMHKKVIDVRNYGEVWTSKAVMKIYNDSTVSLKITLPNGDLIVDKEFENERKAYSCLQHFFG